MAIIMKTPVAKHSVKAKKLQTLANKVLAEGSLSQSTVKELTRVLHDKSTVEAKEFIAFMQEKSGKSEEELLEDIAPWLGHAGGLHAAKERKTVMNHKMLLAWRMQQRGLTLEQIASQLKCSKISVHSYLTGAKGLMRVDPHTIDLPQQIGETLAFYQDVREMALMLASTGTSPGHKLQAMGIALSTERDKNDFLTKVGVYSPSVVQSFQQVVMNHMTVMMSGAQDAQESGVKQFMQAIAKDFMDSASSRIAHASQGDVIDCDA